MNAATKKEKDQLRERIYGNLGQITQSLSAPAKLRILQILSNRPYSVEAISELAGETIGNTSQHLRKMLNAGLVRYEKNGVSRIYSLSNEKVLKIFYDLQSLAADISPQVQEGEEILSPVELCTSLDPAEVLKQVKSEKAILVDARTFEEFKSSQVIGSIHISESERDQKLSSLPKSKTIFVFCRGRYCALANPIVIELRKKGYKAFRLKETFYQINNADVERKNNVNNKK